MKHIIVSAIIIMLSAAASAQQPTSSSQLQRGAPASRQSIRPADSDTRLKQRLARTDRGDSDLQWLRVIYRSLDLTDEANAPLGQPDDPESGDDNLFRTIVKLVAAGRLPAYEFIDGRESFAERYRSKPGEVLDRFHIPYNEAKGSITVESADIPSEEVQSYYIIERWEFDRHENRMRRRVEAICPVLHRADDYGVETLRYPVFWVKMDDLRPYIDGIILPGSDDNNLATHTLNDYFNLRLYKGDIYKTANRRNLALAQIHQTPEALQHARDSIEHRLQAFEKGLWIPSLDEIQAMNEEQPDSAAASSAKKPVPTRKSTTVAKRKPTKPAKERRSSGRSNVTRSVRAQKQ